MRVTFCLLGTFVCVSSALGQAQCDRDNGGLKLPSGFCAAVFADGVTGARHLVVAPNGDVFVAVRNSRDARGGIVALRDTTGDGKADVRVKFGNNGGTGIALHGTDLYFATNDAVLRYTLPAGNLLAHTKPDTVVRSLPAIGGHVAKPIALGSDEDLFVTIGSRTNSCQSQDRQTGSPGQDPCTELNSRAGIWRFNATRRNQAQRDGKRFATGLRNVVAIATGPNGELYGVQHGRDQLFQNWGQQFTAEQSAEKPAEILVRIADGDDYGWPYCFYDGAQKSHVLAPEYGGDGKKKGRCENVKQPLAVYPAHWAPNGLAFYNGTQFPQAYREGAFIAFHGSWNRGPLPEGGNNVVFQRMTNGRPQGEFVVFAEGFAPPDVPPRTAPHRAMGLAIGPDGSLYISDDAGGRIWRVMARRE